MNVYDSSLWLNQLSYIPDDHQHFFVMLLPNVGLAFVASVLGLSTFSVILGVMSLYDLDQYLYKWVTVHVWVNVARTLLYTSSSTFRVEKSLVLAWNTSSIYPRQTHWNPESFHGTITSSQNGDNPGIVGYKAFWTSTANAIYRHGRSIR